MGSTRSVNAVWQVPKADKKKKKKGGKSKQGAAKGDERFGWGGTVSFE